MSHGIMGVVVPGGSPGSEARWVRGCRNTLSPGPRRGLGARVRTELSRGGVGRALEELKPSAMSSHLHHNLEESTPERQTQLVDSPGRRTSVWEAMLSM
ncbi:hypothetical protein INR49_004086 [Caranx melampygus]|nr:hypothetical protein INR49_004144 [Caranx melampygus]KAG7234714.1 hypothetical protein INR49_004086 [Caranx melampygus]